MDYVVHSDDAFLLEGFLTDSECVEQIDRSESIGYEASEIDSGRGMVLDRSIRNNERVLLDDVNLAKVLWSRSKHYFSSHVGAWHPVGLNERFRYYKYEQDAIFRWHRDGPFERPSGERSRMTFMIYLNDDFIGGETDFGDFVVNPKSGSALCFLHSLMHEGRVVSSGTKYVLRTDVMYQQDSG
jgi:prolyl 4-hydroxylase